MPVVITDGDEDNVPNIVGYQGGANAYELVAP